MTADRSAPCVLIVEDSPTQAEQLRWSLEEEGFQVVMARDAEQALGLFDPERVDVMVSDIVMPGASGYELCRRVKTSKGAGEVPVILLSALTDPMTIVRALEAGADNFLTKPYEPQHLIARIRTALSNRALRADGRRADALEVVFRGQKVEIRADKERILYLLMSTFEDMIRTIAEVAENREQLADANARLESYAKELEQRVGERTSELRQRQRQLSDAQEIAGIGDWQLDGASGALRLSDQAAGLLGLDRGVAPAHKDSLLALLHKDSRVQVEALLESAVNRPGKFQAEARFLRPDGDERTCWIVGNSEHDGDGQPFGIFGIIQDISDRRRMETEIRQSDERYRQLFEGIPDAVVVVSKGVISLVNPAAQQLFRAASPHELVGTRFLEHLTPASRTRLQAWRDAPHAEAEGPSHIDCELVTDGTTVAVEVTPSIGDGPDATLQYIVRDVSKRKRMEQQLFQAQKMEAVGQLTGGVAHDFNNLLAIVIGNLDLVENDLAPDSEARIFVSEALAAALRGAELTKQLLAFSRRQSLERQTIDLDQLIGEASALWRRTLGDDVEVKVQLAADTWPVATDPAQLETALLNLVINARDAMPRGGRLTVMAENLILDEGGWQGADREDVAPGDYVSISVSDTGEGMPGDVVERVFEPFFTTKEVGKGSGLGLSMIYGFAKQSGGTVKIYSEPGHGTTVRLCLPRAASSADQADREAVPEALPQGDQETVLVVEDNESVRKIVERQLGDLNYRVITAPNGPEALALLRTESPVDLLFTDIVMPGGLDGFELGDLARTARPGLKVLHTSGFAQAAIEMGAHGRTSDGLLTKPYRKVDLARKLRQILDPPANRSEGP